jgi:outer membrane protein assembly factor BamB
MTRILLTAALFAGSAFAQDFVSARLENWHHWRGPEANGVSPSTNPPVHWDQTTNVKWKIEVPGSGSGTPIVWGDRIYLLTAIKTDRESPDPGAAKPAANPRMAFLTSPTPTTLYEFVVLCLDRKTGKTIWRKIAKEETPHEGHHPTHGYASASATTNGKLLFASFGSRGLFCYDLDGELKWQKDLGDIVAKMGFGETVTPVVHGDALIVVWDHEGDSFITRLNAETGAEEWRVPRDEVTSWSTPLIVEHEGVTQVITSGTTAARSYNLENGELLWERGGQARNPIPSPVAGEDVAYVLTGFRGYAINAVPFAARGELSTESIAWYRDDAAPYVASPVLYDGLLYFTKERRSIIHCVDPKTGEVVYEDQRLPEEETIYSSLVAAAGNIYVTNRAGTTFVIKHGKTYEVLSTNRLEETVNASPVIIDDQLFLRTEKHLYCIQQSR